MIERGDYGPVRIIRGPLVGFLGIYDDDANESGSLAVVLINPPPAMYVTERLSRLEPTDEVSEVWRAFAAANPLVVHQMGYVLKREKSK